MSKADERAAGSERWHKRQTARTREHSRQGSKEYRRNLSRIRAQQDMDAWEFDYTLARTVQHYRATGMGWKY